MRASPSRHAACVAALVVLLGAAPAAAQEPPLAIEGATLHTIHGRSIERGTILIENGRIAALGARVQLPADARRIDASGRHLYPGFIDAHSTLGLVEIGSVRATRDVREVGGITPNVRAAIAVNPDSELIPVARAGGILHVRTAPRDGRISGLSALLQLDGWTWEDLAVVNPLALEVQWPSMTIDRRPQARRKPEEQEKELERELRRLRETFDVARAYVAARDAAASGAAADPVPVDARWEAMRPVLDGTIPVIVGARDQAQMEAALEWAEDEGVRLILSGGADAWRMAETLAAKKVPVILGPTLSMPRRRWEPYDTAYTNAAKLHAAGVRFCISTGGSASSARNLPYHAAMAEAFGLPHAEALRSITLSAAEILGVGERLGSLEVGKDATLLLTDGDPLDIRTHVERAWIAGKEVDLSNRHTRLYERYQGRLREVRE